jgi:hypothetical protein
MKFTIFCRQLLDPEMHDTGIKTNYLRPHILQVSPAYIRFLKPKYCCDIVKKIMISVVLPGWGYYPEYYPDETISKIKNYFSWDKRGVDHIFEALSKIGVPD